MLHCPTARVKRTDPVMLGEAFGRDSLSDADTLRLICSWGCGEYEEVDQYDSDDGETNVILNCVHKTWWSHG